VRAFRSRCAPPLALAVLAAGLVVIAPARPAGGVVSSRYLTMRDGVRIAVDLVLPEEAAGGRVPAILDATRYGRREGALDRLRPFVEQGYAVVAVDARGTGASFGTWVFQSPDEVGDYAEIVDWIAAQPWSNGRVASYGVSYDGASAEMTATRARPALAAVAPTFFTDDLYEDVVYPGGLLNRGFVSWWARLVAGLDTGAGATPVDEDVTGELLRQALAGRPANLDPLAAAVAAPYKDDASGAFSYRASSPASYRSVLASTAIPYLVVTGWLDGANARGALRRFVSLSNPQTVVIGPWNHGGGHDANPFRPPSAPADQREGLDRVLPFLDATLRNADEAPRGRLIRYFTLGENRWHESTVWPVPGLRTRRLFLARGGRLQSSRPGARGGADRYRVRFDATTGARNRWYLTGSDVVYPDRRKADRKLLTFTTRPLARDTEVTGTPVVSLRIASTARDGAFFGYLEDIAPNGRVTYVTEGELRGSSRVLAAASSPLEAGGPLHTYARAAAKPLVPGRITTLRFGLVPTSVLFRRGHRIRLSIAGADRGTFARLPARGRPRLTVFHRAGRASWLELPARPR
jgi:uncharacterized protein